MHHICRDIASRMAMRSTASIRNRSTAIVRWHSCISTRERQFSTAQRCLSRQPGFFSTVLADIRKDMTKNKEMKDNIEKFREEAKKLEQSEALVEARKKYEMLEKQTMQGREFVKSRVDFLKTYVKENEMIKQAGAVGGKMGESLKTTADSISKAGEEFSRTDAARALSSTYQGIRDQIHDAAGVGNVYMFQAPTKLRRRIDLDNSSRQFHNETLAADGESKNVVIHKDFSWYQSWQNFKENNSYMNKIFEFKTRYEESDNVVVRTARVLTDRMSQTFGSVFKESDSSETLNEISKIDATFDTNAFMKQIERDIAPNIFGALMANRPEILKDWCHESAFNILLHDQKDAATRGETIHLQIVDIGEVEFTTAKIMEQGPIIVVTFDSQQISYATDKTGNVCRGDPNVLKSVYNIWALCRDQEVLDPSACWRLIDISSQERGEVAL